MGPFRENAFYLLAWRAFLVALIALVLIATRCFELTTAFLTGANVALVFSLGLIAWSERLSEERIVRTEAWRCLKPNQRPAGRAGRKARQSAKIRELGQVLIDVGLRSLDDQANREAHL
jgi:hypothetical protein